MLTNTKITVLSKTCNFYFRLHYISLLLTTTYIWTESSAMKPCKAECIIWTIHTNLRFAQPLMWQKNKHNDKYNLACIHLICTQRMNHQNHAHSDWEAHEKPHTAKFLFQPQLKTHLFFYFKNSSNIEINLKTSKLIILTKLPDIVWDFNHTHTSSHSHCFTLTLTN